MPRATGSAVSEKHQRIYSAEFCVLTHGKQLVVCRVGIGVTWLHWSSSLLVRMQLLLQCHSNVPDHNVNPSIPSSTSLLQWFRLVMAGVLVTAPTSARQVIVLVFIAAIVSCGFPQHRDAHKQAAPTLRLPQRPHAAASSWRLQNLQRARVSHPESHARSAHSSLASVHAHSHSLTVSKKHPQASTTLA